MSSTTVPYEYLETTGVVVPDTSSILAGVQNEYLAAFGADLIVTPDTPQGVLITAEALARVEVVQNNAALANQINPNIAGGTFLDAIMALTGIQRTPATQTLVTNVSLTGVAGTVIPSGTLAATAAGDQFASLSTITLSNPGGLGTVNFASVMTGPIPCAGSALTTIVSSILGWESVTNNAGGTPASVTTLGSTTQSDQAARALRNNTLAFQGVSLAEAITSALYNVPGVTSLTFQENVAVGTETINGISMVGHSIYACVAGGANTAVAAALLENKSSGCAWNGGTSIAVIEPASGQTYTVQFDRPTPVPLVIEVDTPNGNANNIIAAILNYVAGGVNGLSGWAVGYDISPFEIAAAIVAQYPSYIITNCEISLESDIVLAPTTITIGVNQQATTQISYITVNVG